MIHHTRRVRQINPQQILGYIPERRGFKKTQSNSPLQVVPDGQKGNNTDSMPLDSTPVRDEQGSLVTENGGHSLLPSPLSPIPHSEAQTQALAHPCRRTREICGDYSLTFFFFFLKTRLCQDKPTRPVTEIEEKHREGDTRKPSKVRGTHLSVFLESFFFLCLRSWLPSFPVNTAVIE